MNQTDTSSRPESDAGTARTRVERGRRAASRAAASLRQGVESGSVTAVVGGIGLLRGLRALRRGERGRGLGGLAFGAAMLAAARAQRRSRGRGGPGIDQTDVVDTGPDAASIADEAGGVGEEDHAAGEAAADIVDTSPDVEGVEPEPEPDTDAESASVDRREVADTGVDVDDLAEATEGDPGAGGDATESGDIDRLGEAAFDRQSREVPVPQRAFNQGFLAHSTEATWGIRRRDDAVLVSQDYDAVQGRDGVRYVASSEIGTDVRELPIPNAVLDHWDGVFGGGTAVTGGDDILFVTTDDLAADSLLRVLPAEWADDAFGESE